MLGWAALIVAQVPPAGQMPRDMVAAHNRVRATVGVPPLTWSNKLAAVAQEWADHLLSTGEFSHRPKPNTYGENIYEAWGTVDTAAAVVDYWASEAKDFDAAKNKCRSGAVCGHYTQLVWRNTKQVGCAVAGGLKRQVWVCNYDPPGNWVRQHPY